jgi:hypothetical protein
MAYLFLVRCRRATEEDEHGTDAQLSSVVHGYQLRNTFGLVSGLHART